MSLIILFKTITKRYNMLTCFHVRFSIHLLIVIHDVPHSYMMCSKVILPIVNHSRKTDTVQQYIPNNGNTPVSISPHRITNHYKQYSIKSMRCSNEESYQRALVCGWLHVCMYQIKMGNFVLCWLLRTK